MSHPISKNCLSHHHNTSWYLDCFKTCGQPMPYFIIPHSMKTWQNYKINSENTSASCQKHFATRHRRQNVQNISILFTNPTQITSRYDFSFHAILFAHNTPSKAIAQPYLCYLPLRLLWTSRPTWSKFSDQKMRIGTTTVVPIFLNLELGTSVPSTRQPRLVSYQYQFWVFSERWYHIVIYGNENGNCFTIKCRHSLNGLN